jgi:5-methylcytosine-specific restriction endonuclease McrA
MHDQLSREELVDEVRRVGSEVSEAPTKEQFSEHAKFSVGPYDRRFDGWDSVLEAAGFEPNRRNNVTEDELLSEIMRLYMMYDETPTVAMLKEQGRYSVYSYYNTFERGWGGALEKCGFSPSTGGIRYSDSELISELNRLADELERTPTAHHMTKLGKFSVDVYQSRFGSWNGAIEAAGLEPNVEISIPREDLLQELQSLSNRLGRSPTREELASMSTYSAEPYKREFGSWNDALRAADLPVVKRDRLAEDELLGEVRRVANELGETPSVTQMETLGQIYPSVYIKRFGSWNDAIEAAGLDPTPQPSRIKKETLLTELQNVIDSIDDVPTAEEFETYSEYSRGPYLREFGSWNEAIRALGYEPRYPRGGEDEYRYYGPDWQARRERRIEIDQYQCQKCGLSRAQHYQEYNQDLSVHHIRRLREFNSYENANSLTNLITVCTECHRTVEGKPKSYFRDMGPDDPYSDSI